MLRFHYTPCEIQTPSTQSKIPPYQTPIMSTQLTLTADSGPTYSTTHISHAISVITDSPLDSTYKHVYLRQLDELQSILAASDLRSVENFIATQELQALETDFWRVVELAKEEQVQLREQRAAGHMNQSKSAETWRRYRRSGLGVSGMRVV